jgi:hypothetical protein
MQEEGKPKMRTEKAEFSRFLDAMPPDSAFCHGNFY